MTTIFGSGNSLPQGITGSIGANKSGTGWKVFFAILALIVLLPSAGTPQKPSKQSTKETPQGAKETPPGAADLLNPFDVYLVGARGYRVEPALARFAKTCGISVYRVAPGYAERVEERWRILKNLNRIVKVGTTDSYETLELWHAGPNVVTEQWSVEAGDYYRLYVCLHHSQVISAESVSWNVPDKGSSDERGWGYEVRWELKAGKFARASRFLDLHEEPMAEPKLDEDRKKDLDEQEFEMRTWKDLDYPAALLKEDD